jgi:uncharacterized protein
MNAILSAASSGKSGLLELFLQKGANIESKDSEGRTALMWAVSRGHFEAAKFLLERGANTGARENSLGVTALNIAAITGRTEIVQLLLDYDAKMVAERFAYRI